MDNKKQVNANAFHGVTAGPRVAAYDTGYLRALILEDWEAPGPLRGYQEHDAIKYGEGRLGPFFIVQPGGGFRCESQRWVCGLRWDVLDYMAADKRWLTGTPTTPVPTSPSGGVGPSVPAGGVDNAPCAVALGALVNTDAGHVEHCPWCDYPNKMYRNPSGHALSCPEHAAYIAKNFPAQRDMDEVSEGTGLRHEYVRSGSGHACRLCRNPQTPRATVECPTKTKWFNQLLATVRAVGLIPFDNIGNPQLEMHLINLAGYAVKLRPDLYPVAEQTMAILNNPEEIQDAAHPIVSGTEQREEQHPENPAPTD